MTFAEFHQRMALNALEQDAYSFEVEQAFWQWEKVETLRQYYEMRLLGATLNAMQV